jgi:hypothetical protein
MPVSPLPELVFFARVAGADETCLSSFMPKITVREDYVYRKVVHQAPIPGRHEAHQWIRCLGAILLPLFR